jgi:nucleoid-associated protein YgaU
MATVALDAISYNDAGEVFLAGRATGGGTVQVYIDNVAVAVDRVDDSGAWDSGLPDVPPGIYTMRVDQVADDGTVISRIETPFQREAPAALAAAMADQTGDGFGGVAVKTVQPGNTLWAIARERYGDGVMYVSVFAANADRIRNPDLIYPGQVFVLPEMATDPTAAP